MENQLVKVNPQTYGLDETKAIELTKNLPQIISERDEFVSQFDSIIRMDIDQPETAIKARELRIKIRDNRTKGIEVWHKTTKDYFLKGGNFIDAVKRMEIAVNERMESDLEKIEKYRENIERERIAKLQEERNAEVLKYQEISFPNLGEMAEPVWNNFITGIKVQYQARIDAEKKAEEDRIAREKAEAEEREAQRLENIRLKAEAEERERLAEIERKKQAKLLADQKAKADAERAKLEEKAQKEREEADRKLKAEQAEKAKLEAELKAKADAERKAESDRLAKEEADKKAKAEAEKAPDKQKLTAWIDSLSLSEINASTTSGKAVEGVIREKFTAFKTWAVNQINSI